MLVLLAFFVVFFKRDRVFQDLAVRLVTHVSLQILELLITYSTLNCLSTIMLNK